MPTRRSSEEAVEQPVGALAEGRLQQGDVATDGLHESAQVAVEVVDALNNAQDFLIAVRGGSGCGSRC